LLCLGAAVNCLAYLPFTVLQARGRADLTAKTHLAELPLYLIMFAVVVPQWGIEGAALAWTIRCAADAGALFALARRHVVAANFNAVQMVFVGATLATLFAAVIPMPLHAKAIFLMLALAAFGVLAWVLLLNASERSLARNPLSLVSGQPR